MPAFSLGATGSTPWFILLGPGKLHIGLAGTWTGTALIQEQNADGDTQTANYFGTAASFTANGGTMEFECPKYPVRINFTRSSGTLEPFVTSPDSQIYFPNADAAGGGLTFDNLPTADPEDAGALWNDSGVVTVSAG